jgi:hypothetical protein
VCNSPKKKISSISGYTLTGDLPRTKTFSQSGKTRNHRHQNVLATRMYVKILYKLQTSHRQNNIRTNLDLRNTTLGYGFHFQQRNSRTFPIESLAHDSGRNLVRAEYGYPKGSPDTNSYRRNPPLQLSIQCSPQHTSKRPNSEPHGATRQQAIAETPAK